MLSFALLLGVAAIVAFAAPAPRLSAESSKQDAYYTGGFWSPQHKVAPFASMYGDESRAWLGVMRSPSSKGFEFAVIAEKGEAVPRFQIIDEKGGYHSLPVTALLKLQDASAIAPPKSSDAPVAKAEGPPPGYKLIFGLARAKAAGELAKKENISRAAARQKIDDAIDDATLLDLVKEAKVVVKAQPAGGKLTDFLEWLADHKEVIMAIVAIIMSLFAG